MKTNKKAISSMEKLLSLFILSFFITFQIQAQVINFDDSKASGTFTLNNIGFINWSPQKDYDSEFGTDKPNKYKGVLKFGKQVFELNIFDNSSDKEVTSYYPLFDTFKKVHNSDIKTEHYELINGGKWDVYLTKISNYSGDWVEGMITVFIWAAPDKSLKYKRIFSGSGTFLYNPVTLQIRTNKY